jgi:hypothetical protein
MLLLVLIRQKGWRTDAPGSATAVELALTDSKATFCVALACSIVDESIRFTSMVERPDHNTVCASSTKIDGSSRWRK